MAKSRREQFETQLKSLQDDIHKLSSRFEHEIQSETGSKSSGKASKGPSQPKSRGQLSPEKANFGSNSINNAKTQMMALRKELEAVTLERDDAMANLQLAEQQRDEYRAASLELSKLRVKYENIKQDHESLKISLESSERIRKQQKDLIALLQRSTLVGDEHMNSSAANAMHMASNTSVVSEPELATSPAVLASSRVAEENRSWLNASMTSAQGSSGTGTGRGRATKASRTRAMAASTGARRRSVSAGGLSLGSDAEGNRSRMSALSGGGKGTSTARPATPARATGATALRSYPASRRPYTSKSLSRVPSSGYGQSAAEKRRARDTASHPTRAPKPTARSIYGDYEPLKRPTETRIAKQKQQKRTAAAGMPPRHPRRMAGPRATAAAAVKAPVRLMASAIHDDVARVTAVANTAHTLTASRGSPARRSIDRSVVSSVSVSPSSSIQGVHNFILGGPPRPGFDAGGRAGADSALLHKSTSDRYHHKGHPYAVPPFSTPPSSPDRGRSAQSKSVLTSAGPVAVKI